MSDNRIDELLPCPFCGGEAHTIESARYGKSWGVRCECGAFLGFEYTEAEAIAAWNTRRADVLEIVHCRDCRRYIPQGTHRFNGGVVNKDSCAVIRGFVVQINPDGYCAWGVRKEGDDD